MTTDIIEWLEREGWETLARDVLQARRERGERVEVLRVTSEGRFRYTVTRPLGDEDFRRVSAGAGQLRVISRAYSQTTVTGEATDADLISSLQAAIRAARP